MPERGWTITEVARLLKVSEKTVRRRIERGDLPAYRVSGGRGRFTWLIDSAALGVVTNGGSPAPVTVRETADSPADAMVRPLLELLREKDRQILDLADQLGAARERIRLLEEELRMLEGTMAPDGRRSWMRRLLG